MAGMFSTTGLDPQRSMGVSPIISDPVRWGETKVSNAFGIHNQALAPWTILDSQYAKAAQYEDEQKKIRAQYAQPSGTQVQQSAGGQPLSASDTLLGS